MFGNIGLIRDSRDLKRQWHREYMIKVTQPPISSPTTPQAIATSPSMIFIMEQQQQPQQQSLSPKQ